MFYWIYDLPPLWVIFLFEAVFVGVFWLGAIFLRRFARSWLKEEPRLNEMLAAFFQYFGVIFGLLLGLLAVATYQNRSDVEKSNANEAITVVGLDIAKSVFQVHGVNAHGSVVIRRQLKRR